MYDWPERRAEVDAQWVRMRGVLRANGYDAPEHLSRRNADVPAVPGGIRDAAGQPHRAGPRRPFRRMNSTGQHCGFIPTFSLRRPAGGLWISGLGSNVHVIGQDDYSGIEGGAGELYSQCARDASRRGRCDCGSRGRNGLVASERAARTRGLHSTVTIRCPAISRCNETLPCNTRRSISLPAWLKPGRIARQSLPLLRGKQIWPPLIVNPGLWPSAMTKWQVHWSSSAWTGRRKGLPFISAFELGVRHVHAMTGLQTANLD